MYVDDSLGDPSGMSVLDGGQVSSGRSIGTRNAAPPSGRLTGPGGVSSGRSASRAPGLSPSRVSRPGLPILRPPVPSSPSGDGGLNDPGTYDAGGGYAPAQDGGGDGGGGGGAPCPEGLVLGPDGVSCVPVAAPPAVVGKSAASEPWYSKPWPWIAAGAAVLGIAVAWAASRRNR